jgi:hydroxymethylglutaryl-CoA reductase (NADPH)
VSVDHRHAASHLERLFQTHSQEELARRLAPKSALLPPKVPGGSRITPEILDRRWQVLADTTAERSQLLDPETMAQLDRYQKNIENFLGTVKIPIGLAGPLRVNGLFAQGDYYIPLATTEAALVASYNRGSQLISEAGGCTAALLNEGVSRAPGFAFRSLEECGRFVVWVTSQLETLRHCAEETSHHGKLKDMRLSIEGNHVYLNFEFLTGDACGQNMVTIATDAICTLIQEQSPVRPQYYFLEANMSGDKKASAQSFLLVRGKKVSAEICLASELVNKWLHTTPEHMVSYWRMSAMGGVLSGTLGIHGHYANGLAALYLACGQDVACVAESAVGVTRFEVTSAGALYASVTLPNIMVGTVGGGTGLPSQQACLNILGLAGQGKAKALAEVTAGVCLAGELSIIGALCAGDFSRAHRLLARGKARADSPSPETPLPEGEGSKK